MLLAVEGAIVHYVAGRTRAEECIYASAEAVRPVFEIVMVSSTAENGRGFSISLCSISKCLQRGLQPSTSREPKGLLQPEARSPIENAAFVT